MQNFVLMDFHICVLLTIFIATFSLISRAEAHAMQYLQKREFAERRAGFGSLPEPFFRGRSQGKKSFKWKQVEHGRQRKKKPVSFKQNKADDVSTHKYLTSFALKRQLDVIAMESENNITVEVLGKTVEYNDIVLLRMAKKDSRFRTADETKYDDELHKKVIFIVHGLDTGGLRNLDALTFIADFKTLLSFYEMHLDKFDIFLIPVANPDGASYTTTHRHKNMSPQGQCFGVHLDRNFDIGWKNMNKNPCSSFYPGPMPFSEPESRAVKDILHRYSNKIVGYLHVHAASDYDFIFKGEAVLYPKGYTDVQRNDDKYIDLRSEIDEALKNATFKMVTMTVEPLHSWYGKVAGTSVDYASTIYGVPYALELCMQSYPDQLSIDYESISLNQVWSRVINVLFNTINRGTPRDTKR